MGTLLFVDPNKKNAHTEMHGPLQHLASRRGEGPRGHARWCRILPAGSGEKHPSDDMFAEGDTQQALLSDGAPDEPAMARPRHDAHARPSGPVQDNNSVVSVQVCTSLSARTLLRTATAIRAVAPATACGFGLQDGELRGRPISIVEHSFPVRPPFFFLLKIHPRGKQMSVRVCVPCHLPPLWHAVTMHHHHVFLCACPCTDGLACRPCATRSPQWDVRRRSHPRVVCRARLVVQSR